MDASDIGADLKDVLIPADRLQARVAELAAQIDADYAGRELLLVGVLKGAVMVMADLARAMHMPAQMDWMAVSSYGSGTRSSGVVRILKDLDTDITGKDVLVVEDIVDSGLTLSWLVGNLRSRGPASVKVCVMLRKPAAAADGRGRRLHRLRHRERVRDRVRSRLRREVPESSVHRHSRAACIQRRGVVRGRGGTRAGAVPPIRRRAAGRSRGTGSADRSVEVCGGSLSPGGSFSVPAVLSRGVPSGIPAARPGMTSAAGYD